MNFIGTVALCFAALTLSASEWANPLYFSGGGVWTKRIPVEVRNSGLTDVSGDRIRLKVGGATDELPLAGVPVRELRLTGADGEEYLFALTKNGVPYEEDAIPEGSVLTVPVEVAKGKETTIFLYYGNPRARKLPEHLSVPLSGYADSFETGGGDAPAEWRSLLADDGHCNRWSDSVALTGKRSLQTSVGKGTGRSWVSWARDFAVTPGSVYRVSGWIRGDRVEKGKAGLYVHVEGSGKGLLVNRVDAPFSGTFDWREIEFEVTIPPGGNRLRLGTVMNGEGDAWFDDLSVERRNVPLLPAGLTARILPPETLKLSSPVERAWDLPPQAFPARIPIRCVNPANTPSDSSLYEFPLQRSSHADPPDADIRLLLNGKTVPYLRIGGQLYFELGAIPAKTEQVLYLYLAADLKNVIPDSAPRLLDHDKSDYHFASTQAVNAEYYGKLLNSSANLLKNGSFEQKLEGWTYGGESDSRPDIMFDTFPGGLFGKAIARYVIPGGGKLDWIGLRQKVNVHSGKDFLLAGWNRSRPSKNSDGTDAFQARPARIYYHLFERGIPDRFRPGEAAGSNSPDNKWRFDSAVCRVSGMVDPVLEIHLTVKGEGEFEYDGVLLAEVRMTLPLPIEYYADRDNQGVAVWQENTIRKVFKDSFRSGEQGTFLVEMARNESEGLLLAFRSSSALSGLSLDVTVPEDGRGNRLEPPAIGVIGYVPVDSVSEYYKFHQNPWTYPVPNGSTVGTDFPDPVIPGNQFSLKSKETQGVRLGFRTTSGTVPGDYSGEIILRQGAREISRHPYRVHVWNLELGKRPNFVGLYDVRRGKGGYSGEELIRFMASQKLNPDRVPAEPSFSLDGGRVKADFSAYDRMARIYFDELKLPFSYFPHFFYAFGWGNVPGDKLGIKAYDGAPQYTGIDRSRFRPEYRRVYQEALRLFWNHVREKGWSDRLVLYLCDEPHRKPEIMTQLAALCDMIHEVDPGIRIYSSTWYYWPELDGKLDIFGAGPHGTISVEQMKTIRDNGASYFFTTDGQLCLDTESCATERMLPLFCLKYGAELYEFWGFDWYTRNPFEFGQHKVITERNAPGVTSSVRYPNGDGYLVYPGRLIGAEEKFIPSIRTEAARDGVEDFDYYRQLVDLANSGNRAAAETLAEIKALISMPNRGGRNSIGILPDPDRFLELRRKMAQVIEQEGR